MSPDGPSAPPAEPGPGEAPASAGTLLADPRLVSILLLSGVGVLGTQAIPPVLPAIQSSLGVSDARIGLVLTALFLPAVVLVPVTGAICDIYGRRRVTLLTLFGFGTAGVGIFFAPTFEVLLALRVVQGICFATLTPLSVAFVGDFFQGTEGTTAQGIRVSTNGVVIIVAPIVAGVLAEVAWNYPFLLYLAAFPVMLVVYRHFPEPDAFEGGPTGSVVEETRAWAGGVARTLNDRTLLLLLLGGFMLFGVRYIMLTVAPLLATRTIGLRPSVVGVAIGLLGVVRILVAPQAGRLSAWLPRRTVFVLTMSVIAASMAVFSVVDSLPLFVAGVVVFSVGMSLFNPTLNDTVTVSSPTENRAGVVAAMQSTKNLANTVSPAAAGLLLAATDFRTVFTVAAGLAVAYVVVIAVGLDPDE